MPPEAYVLTAEQTALTVQVRSAHVDGGDLVLDVAAWFPNVDLVDPTLSVKTDGDDVEIAPRRRASRLRISRQDAQRRYPRSGWTVTSDRRRPPCTRARSR